MKIINGDRKPNKTFKTKAPSTEKEHRNFILPTMPR